MFRTHGSLEGGGAPQTPETVSFIEYVQAQGPVQTRLRARFGREMASWLDALALTLTSENSIVSGIASDGSKRPRNEDSSVVLHAYSGSERTSVPVVLAAVADGIGGRADGDEASAIAVQMLAETVADAVLDSARHPERLSATSIEHTLISSISDAYDAVIASTNHGGTTLTCAMIAGDTATIAHIGDSRAYLLDFEAGTIHLLTHDHTFAFRMAEAGLLTEREAASHPQSHVIYRVIGEDGRREADIVRCPLTPESAILLCTDGVWRPLAASDIYEIVRRADNPQDACEQLVMAATAPSGNDEATAVLARMPEQLSAAEITNTAHAGQAVEPPLELSLAAQAM